MPVMIIAGSDDQHVTSEESHRLFNATNDPKSFWLIEGAKHQNFHRFAGKQYEKKVMTFFQKNLEQ